MSNISELRKNEFWVKKFNQCLKYLDANKDGKISRADFDLIVKNYKDLGAPESHLEKLRVIVETCLVAWGLQDEKVEYTYEQAGDVYAGSLQSADTKAAQTGMFTSMFDQIDIDADGWISYEEWVIHYKANKMDVNHARASFDAMDANKDGKISKDEFVNYHTEFFYTAEDKLHSSILFGPLP